MTKNEIAALINAVEAIRVALKELGTVPSGVFYTRVMQHLSIDNYNRVLDLLVQAKQITVTNHVITYVGR